jgi:hypothetical protein
MQRRKLGELEVSAIGLGCATMTPFYGEPDPRLIGSHRCPAIVRSIDGSRQLALADLARFCGKTSQNVRRARPDRR